MELRALFIALEPIAAKYELILEDWSQLGQVHIRDSNFVMTATKYDLGYRVSIESTLENDIRTREKRFHHSVVVKGIAALLRKLPRVNINSAYFRTCHMIRFDERTDKKYRNAGRKDIRDFGYENCHTLLRVLSGLEDNGLIQSFTQNVFDDDNVKIAVKFKGSEDALAQVFGYKTFKDMKHSFVTVSSGNIWCIELETATQLRMLHMAFYNY